MSVQTKEAKRVNESEHAGYVLGPDEGLRMSAVGVTITFRATGADTGGRFSLFEMTVPPNFDGPPPHWHKETAEAFFVLDGTVTAISGEERTPISAGGCWHVPTGVVHTYANESDEPATFVALLTPSDMETYFFKLVALVQEASEWPPQDPEMLAAVGELARRYDQHPPETAPSSGQTIIRQPGEGRSFSIRGQTMTWKTVGEQTDGKIATLVYDGPAGAPGPPTHYHAETHEVGYVLQGDINFRLDGREVEAGPGSFFYIPPSVVHDWSGAGENPVKFMGFALPAGIENYFFELIEMMESEPTWPPDDPSKIMALGRKYDQFPAERPD